MRELKQNELNTITGGNNDILTSVAAGTGLGFGMGVVMAYVGQDPWVIGNCTLAGLAVSSVMGSVNYIQSNL